MTFPCFQPAGMLFNFLVLKNTPCQHTEDEQISLEYTRKFLSQKDVSVKNGNRDLVYSNLSVFIKCFSLRLVQVIQLIIPETTSFAQDNSLKMENAFDLCNCDQISQTKTKFKSIFHLRECCPEPISSSNIQTKYTHSHTFSSMLDHLHVQKQQFFFVGLNIFSHYVTSCYATWCFTKVLV